MVFDPPSPTVAANEAYAHPALVGWVFGGERALLVNLSGQHRVVDLGVLGPAGGVATWRQIFATATTHVARDGVLTEMQGVVSDQLVLPGYSLTAISLPDE